MKWDELTYKRKMELALWTELDKAGCILEPDKPLIGNDRKAFVRAVNAWRDKYKWADNGTVAEITGLSHQRVISIINTTVL